MSALLSNITYYQEQEDIITALLDQMVEAAKPLDGDIPAFTFAVLVQSLGTDQAKAVTVAAAALMRLGELKRAAEAPCGDTFPVDHGPVKPPYGTPERAAYDAQQGGLR